MKERTSTLRLAALVAAISAVGTFLLAVAHTGIEVPVLSALGPQGGAVPPAVAGFAVGTLLFASIAAGLRRGQRWAWFAGLTAAGLGIAGGLGQFRGPVSAVGIALAVVLGGLLLAPGSRGGISPT